ncbi:DUF6090 family protein [Hanstruepera marina]|uniref:DUF6090 family protein n=1 Tax=Hanstruepera marina TaxID=2873265 RepID=UPI001CA63D20|nr:DUF6090 family protein [Hanstruepera marina]
MIKFFRNIRKKLASENKAMAYSRYAIGEIILVVIGILIALQINNWNENRKNKIQEDILLEQLLADFNSNLKQLDQKISMRNIFMEASKQLLNFIDNPSQREKDSINYNIARTMPYASFDPIIIDLASSGDLNLIKNETLKHALTRWTSEINDVIEDEVIWKDYRNNLYIPFLIENYQLRTIRNLAYKTDLLGSYSLEVGEKITDYSKDAIGESAYNVDYNMLLNHPNFEDHLTRCYAINSWANVQSQILRKRIVEIIDLIKQELEHD